MSGIYLKDKIEERIKYLYLQVCRWRFFTCGNHFK